MPLFEYICFKCEHKFEELVLKSDDQVVCPKCGSQEVAKQISAFSSSSLTSGSSCTKSSCSKSGFG